MAFWSSWETWEQLTFVLAGGIVIVVLLGLGKLWYMSRFLAKHKILDEEKKTRLSEMRKSGIQPSEKKNDIPFGVRAIQSGIEVDGIWISKGAIPSQPVPKLPAQYEVEKKTKIVPRSDLSPSPDMGDLMPTSRSQSPWPVVPSGTGVAQVSYTPTQTASAAHSRPPRPEESQAHKAYVPKTTTLPTHTPQYSNPRPLSNSASPAGYHQQRSNEAVVSNPFLPDFSARSTRPRGETQSSMMTVEHIQSLERTYSGDANRSPRLV